jgi:hypothetical protein
MPCTVIYGIENASRPQMLSKAETNSGHEMLQRQLRQYRQSATLSS